MLIATGDLHAHPYAEFSRSVGPDGLTPLGKRILDTTKWLTNLTKDGDLLVNGDLTTTPGYLDAATIHLLSKMEGIFGSTRRIYNLGNHDQGSKGLPFHNLELVSHGSGPDVVLSGSVGVYSTSIGQLYVVPYTHTIEDQRALLLQIPDSALVAIHYPIFGIMMTPSVSEEVGLDPIELRRFRLVLSSHYHIPQVWYSNESPAAIQSIGSWPIRQGTILSLGTPLAHSFGDTNPVYGCAKIVEGSFSFVENPVSPVYHSMSPTGVEEVLEFVRGVRGKDVFLSLTVKDSTDPQWSSDKLQGVVNGVRVRGSMESSSSSRRSFSAPTDILPVMSEYMTHVAGVSQDEAETIQSFLSPLISSMRSQEGVCSGSLKFKTLDLAGFMSWGKASLSFDDSGSLTLVQGVNHDTEAADSNGSGKSSLLESLAWVLFDKTFRGAGKDEVIRQGGGSVKVTVSLDYNGYGYRVSRYRGDPSLGTGASIVREDPSGEIDLSATSVSETNKVILSTLGLTWENFCLTTFFGQGFSERFSSLSDSEKKKVLEATLGLSVYDTLRVKAQDALKEITTNVVSLSSECSSAENTLRNSKASLEEQANLAEKEEAAAKVEVSSISNEIKGILSEESSIEYKASVLRGYYEEYSSEVKSLQESFDAKFKAGLLAQKSLSSVVTEYAQKYERLRSVKSRLSELSMELVKFSATCPSCGSDLPKEKADALREALAKKLVQPQKELQTLSVECEHLLEKKALLEAQAASISEEELTKHTKRINEVLEEQRSCQKGLNEVLASADTFSRRKYSLEARLHAISEMDFYKTVRVLQKSIDTLSKSLDSRLEDLAAIKEKERVAKKAAEILDPRGVRSYLLDAGVGSINRSLSTVSKTLFGGDYSVQLTNTVTRKSGEDANILGLVVSTPGGSYLTASGGERRKADLAIHLALRDLSLSQGRGGSNLLVADEVLDTLDATSSRRVVDALSKYAESGDSVFLISHSPLVAPLVQRVLSVVKQGGESHVLTT